MPVIFDDRVIMGEAEGLFTIAPGSRSAMICPTWCDSYWHLTAPDPLAWFMRKPVISKTGVPVIGGLIKFNASTALIKAGIVQKGLAEVPENRNAAKKIVRFSFSEVFSWRKPFIVRIAHGAHRIGDSIRPMFLRDSRRFSITPKELAVILSL